MQMNPKAKVIAARCPSCDDADLNIPSHRRSTLPELKTWLYRTPPLHGSIDLSRTNWPEASPMTDVQIVEF